MLKLRRAMLSYAEASASDAKVFKIIECIKIYFAHRITSYLLYFHFISNSAFITFGKILFMIFDILFLIIFLWAIYKGYTKGFILQAATLAALILGIFGAIKFSGLTATIIIEKLGFNWQYMHLIAFAITFVGIVIGIHFLARLFEKLLKAIAINMLNRLLGIMFSLIKYAFIISAVLVVINGINRRAHFISEEKINQSVLYRPLSMLAPLLFPYLHFDFTHPLDVPDEPDEEIIV